MTNLAMKQIILDTNACLISSLCCIGRVGMRLSRRHGWEMTRLCLAGHVTKPFACEQGLLGMSDGRRSSRVQRLTWERSGMYVSSRYCNKLLILWKCRLVCHQGQILSCLNGCSRYCNTTTMKKFHV